MQVINKYEKSLVLFVRMKPPFPFAGSREEDAAIKLHLLNWREPLQGLPWCGQKRTASTTESRDTRQNFPWNCKDVGLVNIINSTTSLI